MNLTKLGEKTYVIESPTNVGVYILDNNNVCLIDTGNSKDTAKNIDKILIANNWHVKYIINTHSHADHIGGNKYFQDKYHCQIFANKIESYFINKPILEPALLYGALPIKELRTHFLLAKPSVCEDINNFVIPGISTIDLSGHSAGLIGIETSDKVLFVGDAYTSQKILEKYTIQYTYDVKKYLDTLNFLKTTNYDFYVPSHGEIEKDIANTLMKNETTTLNIEQQILDLIKKPITYDDLVLELCNFYHITLNMVQYYVIGVTIKSMLTKLQEENKVVLNILNGKILIEKTI